MKYVWLTVGASTLLLTGCTGMMYGNNTAPVNNHNVYSGKQVPLNNTNQTGVFSQSAQTNIQAQPARPKTQITPYGQNPTLAQNAAQLPYQGMPANSSQSYTPVQQASPYMNPNTNNDGWNVRPSNSTTNNMPVDEPKVDNNNMAQNNKPQAIRPPQRDEQNNVAQNDDVANSNTSNNNQTNDETSNQQTEQQVASASPTQPTNNNNDSGDTAVSSLLKKASASLGKGDLDGAVGYLENAQRIDPQNSKILYDIANIRYHQGKHREAESFASRAVQVGGSNAMMKKSWSLIANARKALGDNQGAIMAVEKATSL